MDSFREFVELPDQVEFDFVISKLREFFKGRGFMECYGCDLTILAACEDPKNMAKFKYIGQEWPHMQTGQMNLERIILTHPEYVEPLYNENLKEETPNVEKYHSKGLFSITNSFREEPNPIRGRHKMIFPLFEFEIRGDIFDLGALETELLEFLGFDKPTYKTYEEWSKHYKSKELTHEHERQMCKEFSNACFIEKFPMYTEPFWNMKRMDNKEGPNSLTAKIDVILGDETIGSAERSCDPNDMRKRFYEQANGEYCELLFKEFGKERVLRELDEYLSYKFITRAGAGIGVTRLINAMRANGLIKN